MNYFCDNPFCPAHVKVHKYDVFYQRVIEKPYSAFYYDRILLTQYHHRVLLEKGQTSVKLCSLCHKEAQQDVEAFFAGAFWDYRQNRVNFYRTCEYLPPKKPLVVNF